MAIVQMQRIRVCGLRRQRKHILELLQRRGVVEIDEPGEDQAGFERADVSSQRASLEKELRQTQEALQILQDAVPEKKPPLSMLAGRSPLTEKELEDFREQSAKTMALVRQVTSAAREREEIRASLLRLETEEEALAPWSSLDVPLRSRGTKTTAVFAGTLPGEWTAAALEGRAEPIPLSVEIVSVLQDQTCLFAVCLKRDREAAEQFLRSLGFAAPAAAGKTPPSERREAIGRESRELAQREEELQKELGKLAGQRRDIQLLADSLTMRIEKYHMIDRLLQTKHTFLFAGYVPAANGPALEKELEACGAAAELSAPGPDDDVPVLLKNNKFTEPVEGVLESYSMPGKGEIDPTPVMAIFYYVLFGMMLSDAAYGLIMVIACGFCLLRFKNMEPGMRKSLRMFFFCGISTAFWGFMYGSFFGDVVAVFSKTFLGHETVLAPLWFAPVDDPMRMLLFSMLMGIIQIFAGLALCAYQLLRQKRVKDAIYDVAFWYLLVGGLIFALLSSDMFSQIAKMDKLPAIFGTVGGVCAAVGAVGILLTGGRESKNPVKRLLKGAYALYNVTGYLGDILSYSRLLALGLATGVIAEVINSMAVMAGGGVIGFIAFVIIFVFGHTVNIGINLLGAYVHTNRLQFVEFFGKFYSGDGRKFTPFADHTKYFKIREEK